MPLEGLLSDWLIILLQLHHDDMCAQCMLQPIHMSWLKVSCLAIHREIRRRWACVELL